MIHRPSKWTRPIIIPYRLRGRIVAGFSVICMSVKRRKYYIYIPITPHNRATKRIALASEMLSYGIKSVQHINRHSRRTARTLQNIQHCENLGTFIGRKWQAVVERYEICINSVRELILE
jgi:hypothetical protein